MSIFQDDSGFLMTLFSHYMCHIWKPLAWPHYFTEKVGGQVEGGGWGGIVWAHKISLTPSRLIEVPPFQGRKINSHYLRVWYWFCNWFNCAIFYYDILWASLSWRCCIVMVGYSRFISAVIYQHYVTNDYLVCVTTVIHFALKRNNLA